MPSEGGFVWYELATHDAAAAVTFYAEVVGWAMADAGMPGFSYTLAKVEGRPVAGLMELPPAVAQVRPGWRGYLFADDVDRKAEEVAAAGGTVHRAPDDIPGVGRFAVAADPQGATFMLFRPQGTAEPAFPPGTPGTVGWHELRTRDWPAAFAFYGGLFGWEKAQAIDMGPMGVYQTFSVGGTWTGGMMDGPEAPSWLYYFTVEAIDAAAARVVEAGGTVRSGPHEVPGGSWVLQGVDPQGVSFALVGPRA